VSNSLTYIGIQGPPISEHKLTCFVDGYFSAEQMDKVQVMVDGLCADIRGVASESSAPDLAGMESNR
jgi:hypothetical protein